MLVWGSGDSKAPSDEKLTKASSLLITEWTTTYAAVFLVSSDFVPKPPYACSGFVKKKKIVTLNLKKGCKVLLFLGL
jgi:hypothetical protein